MTGPDECEDAIRRLIADIDPAVDLWAEAWREHTGRDLTPKPADRRTPFEVERDNALEDRAEARADRDGWVIDYLADLAATDEQHILGEN